MPAPEQTGILPAVQGSPARTHQKGIALAKLGARLPRHPDLAHPGERLKQQLQRGFRGVLWQALRQGGGNSLAAARCHHCCFASVVYMPTSAPVLEAHGGPPKLHSRQNRCCCSANIALAGTYRDMQYGRGPCLSLALRLPGIGLRIQLIVQPGCSRAGRLASGEPLARAGRLAPAATAGRCCLGQRPALAKRCALRRPTLQSGGIAVHARRGLRAAVPLPPPPLPAIWVLVDAPPAGEGGLEAVCGTSGIDGVGVHVRT